MTTVTPHHIAHLAQVDLAEEVLLYLRDDELAVGSLSDYRQALAAYLTERTRQVGTCADEGRPCLLVYRLTKRAEGDDE